MNQPESLTLARKPTLVREWCISIIREEIQYLGRVSAPDKEAAYAKAMEEYRIEPARRLRLIVVPVASKASCRSGGARPIGRAARRTGSRRRTRKSPTARREAFEDWGKKGW